VFVQLRDKEQHLQSFIFRNFTCDLGLTILVFCAYTFILWHTKTGGLRRRWASKPLNTFVEAYLCLSAQQCLSATPAWLNHNRDVFAAYKAALGFVWA